jgi:hypothetical protein
MEDVLDLAYKHGGYEYKRALEYFWNLDDFPIYTEYDNKGLRAFLCYIELPLEYDMICVTDREDVFTLSTWRILSKELKLRTKEIRIDSVANNPTIDKAIQKYGGYREDNVLIFEYRKE